MPFPGRKFLFGRLKKILVVLKNEKQKKKKKKKKKNVPLHVL